MKPTSNSCLECANLKREIDSVVVVDTCRAMPPLATNGRWPVIHKYRVGKDGMYYLSYAVALEPVCAMGVARDEPLEHLCGATEEEMSE